MRRFNLDDLACLLTIVAVLASAGCEEGPDTTEATTYFDKNPYSSTVTRPDLTEDTSLKTNPEEVALHWNGEVAKVQATGGKPPYKWVVWDISAGTIIEVSGTFGEFAVYRDDPIYTNIADNAVIVTDADGLQAFCLVKQYVATTTTTPVP